MDYLKEIKDKGIETQYEKTKNDFVKFMIQFNKSFNLTEEEEQFFAEDFFKEFFEKEDDDCEI